MKELTYAVNSKAKDESNLKEVGSQLSRYGAMLSPGLNLAFPGLGLAIQGGFKAAEKAMSKDESITSVREKLVKSLSNIDVPIVVLIDELDRIEDSEILAVAQLVRAVVDFPKISFALAYDVDRVIEALGRSSKERGSSYLEKIVQLQVPIPIQLPNERVSLLKSELERLKLVDSDGHQFSYEGSDFNAMADLLNSGFLSTPRDIKRVCGTFHALHGMVGGEVYWVELLAYAALLSKNPTLVESIRREPERVVLNALDGREIARRSASSREKSLEWLNDLVGANNEPAKNVMQRLFPILDPSRSGTPVANALAFRRPLLTVLRLGQVPGTLTRDEAASVLALPRSDAVEALWAHQKAGSLGALIDRLDGVASEGTMHASDQFWLGVSDFLAKSDTAPLAEVPFQRDAVPEFVGLAMRAVARNRNLRPLFVRVTDLLIEEENITLAPALVRPHFWAHGMHSFSVNHNAPRFLTKDETESRSKKIGLYLNEKYENRSILGKIYSMEPIYMLQSIRKSDSIFKSIFDEHLNTRDGLDSVTIIWFASSYVSKRSFFEQFCSVDTYVNMIRERRMSIDDDQLVLAEAFSQAETSLQR